MTTSTSAATSHEPVVKFVEWYEPANELGTKYGYWTLAFDFTDGAVLCDYSVGFIGGQIAKRWAFFCS
jgi:hypothetical protein